MTRYSEEERNRHRVGKFYRKHPLRAQNVETSKAVIRFIRSIQNIISMIQKVHEVGVLLQGEPGNETIKRTIAAVVLSRTVDGISCRDACDVGITYESSLRLFKSADFKGEAIMLNNMQIGTRLMMLLTMVLLLMVGVGVAGLFGMHRTNEGLRTVYEDHTVALSHWHGRKFDSGQPTQYVFVAA